MSTLNIIEASKELQVSTRTIRTYLKNGKLQGKIIGQKYEITVESVRNFKEASGGALKRKATQFQTQQLSQMVTVDLGHYEGLITRATQLEAKLSDLEDKEQKLLEYQNTNQELSKKLEKVEAELAKEKQKGVLKRIREKLHF